MNDKGKIDLTKSMRTLSFKRFNLAEIPVINLDNQILAERQRIAILIELGRGDEVLDVSVPNRQLKKKEADEYLLRSNKNTGDWNVDILGESFNFDFLKEVEFNDFELDKIFEMFLKEEEFNAQKEYENIKEAMTKKGDVYILGLGDHHLETMVERLCESRKTKIINFL
ncbi:MAG: hypothetical protein LE180_04230 [Endomicrobium sp.]|uniref:hypothetical protein n=1 Tax=Candidatus Endomicrobiellum pyrsonymphae TaxID=1408203 RepID=UPI0035720805|nr:hypothetical protein [Endomicrobium sp.]